MIKHVMADGTILDSVKGVVVPVTPITEAAYRTVHEIMKRKTRYIQHREDWRADNK